MEEGKAAPQPHEAYPRNQVNWDSKIMCTCGERCASWMEFWKHRGDAYAEALGIEHDA